jgi:hypothetical protein
MSAGAILLRGEALNHSASQTRRPPCSTVRTARLDQSVPIMPGNLQGMLDREIPVTFGFS